MERSRSYLLTFICLIAVTFAVFLWSDKQETSQNLELAMNELRELNDQLIQGPVNENKDLNVISNESIFEEIGSGDMK